MKVEPPRNPIMAVVMKARRTGGTMRSGIRSDSSCLIFQTFERLKNELDVLKVESEAAV